MLTVGTFPGGRILIGRTEKAGGRVGDAPSNRLAARLRELPFNVARLKTGTPPRLDGKTLNYALCRSSPAMTRCRCFRSSASARIIRNRCPATSPRQPKQTHDIIRGALDESPMYSGLIEGVGPRYCPSIEDKVVRFADKASHQIFVEPEGLTTDIVYPNGISTSLPHDTQERFVRSIVGFENGRITQPGYAIEYDYFDPRDLKPTLETKHIDGPVFRRADQRHDRLRRGRRPGPAGRHQRRAATRKDWKSGFRERHEAYLGVLIDDLITRGVSRAVSYVHEPRRISPAAARGQR